MSDKAFFIGDHAALDFLNTIAAPRWEVIESIADGGAYLAWLVDAGLLDAAAKQPLMDKFAGPALDLVAGEARDLREWFRQLIAKAANPKARPPVARPPAEAVATLNRLLAIGSSHRQLETTAKRIALCEKHTFTKARQLLVPVAEAIAALVTDSDPSLVKRCANPACSLWFYDRTKAHRRLFCSAAVCGNRAKVAAFRERQRQAR